MKYPSFHSIRTVHVIGVGGIGISALAQYFASEGKRVSGSDAVDSPWLHELERKGISVSLGHASKNLPKNANLVIYSLAIPPKNIELLEARKRGLPLASYPEALGLLTKQFNTIAICGTHGKTTVTALIAKILIEHQFDPTVIVGSRLKELGNSNFHKGRSRILIIEACEYRRAFLNFHPRIILLHTLELDHLDYYRDIHDYVRAFQEFALKLPHDGYFFGNLDEDHIQEIFQFLQEKHFPSYNVFTYGKRFPQAHFYLQDRTIVDREKRAGILDLLIPGDHNRMNALAAYAVTRVLGLTPRQILESLHRYEGAARRFEKKGMIGKTLLYDDYAHHPTEIEATLQAFREKFPKEKICVIFQPHQYSRTRELLDRFARSFQQADTVIIPNIYEARDSKKDKASISENRLVAEIHKHHPRVQNGRGISSTASYVKTHLKDYDVIITMGAGDVWKIGEALIGS